MEPSCLVVGPPLVGKYTLIRSLQLVPESKNTTSCTYSLTLDTKYYTADVVAQSVGTQFELSDAIQPEALLLVFDISKQASFDSVRAWAENRNTEDVEVKLLVANKADMLQQDSSHYRRAPWLEEAINWCYNYGFEYVETAAGQPKVDAILQLDGEQQGLARVLAALQAHMWPSMVEKHWSPAPLSSINTAKGSTAVVRDQGSSSAVASDAIAANAAKDAPARPAVADGSRETHKQGDGQQQTDRPVQQQQQAEVSTAPSPTDPHRQQQQLEQQQAGTGSSPATAAQQQQTQQEQQQQQAQAEGLPAFGADDSADLDFDLDDFEKLMRQMAGMRARISGLPDADRRTAAAEMALKLATLMGLGDEAESSDGEDVAQLDVHRS